MAIIILKGHDDRIGVKNLSNNFFLFKNKFIVPFIDALASIKKKTVNIVTFNIYFEPQTYFVEYYLTIFLAQFIVLMFNIHNECIFNTKGELTMPRF